MATIHHQPLPLEAALAMLPSLPRPVLSRLVTRMIQRLDEIDGDPDCDEDDSEDAFAFSALVQSANESAGSGCDVSDPDAGLEDDRLGFDLEDDYCLAHEDLGTQGCLTTSEKKEVRRVKQITHALCRKRLS